MKECIICRARKEPDLFNDEHVIPDSLGGYYHIYTVCIDCNSNLGTQVDSNLVNHKFSDFLRYILGIKGKSGHIPNPFAGTHSFSDKPEQKVQVRLDSDNKIIPYIIPKIKHNKNNGVLESVNIVIDASDESQLNNIINKIAKRIGVPSERIVINEKQVQTERCPEIHVPLSIDLHDFKLGLLKIAYEYAVDSIPDYYDDTTAIEISKVLFNADHSKSTDFVKIGDGFQHEIMGQFEHLLAFDEKKHYLILVNTQSLGLICFVKLHRLFTVGIVLSGKQYLKDNILIGINDIDKKIFRKLDFFELINETHSIPELRFQYYFANQSQVNEFMEIEKQSDFRIYEEDGEIPFFYANGEHAGKTVHQKQTELMNVAQFDNSTAGLTITRIEMNEVLYLKASPSNKLLMVLAIQEERRQICKL